MSRDTAKAQAIADQIGNGSTVGTFGATPLGDSVIVAVPTPTRFQRLRTAVSRSPASPLDIGGLETASVPEWTGILLMGLARNGAGFDVALGAEIR